MKFSTDHQQDIAIVRIGESRMMYPLLADFANAVTALITSGSRKLIIDMSAVGYIDSATIGCLMDLYRQMSAAGGGFKLSGVQRRVETMLTMTGAHNFIEIHEDEAQAIEGFGGTHAHN